MNIVTTMYSIPDTDKLSVIDVNARFWYNPELDYKWFMAPGILSILVTLIGLFLSGMGLVKEKEQGTIEQLNVSPVKKHEFIIGKLVPFLIIALFDLAFGLILARFVFNLPIVGSLFTLFGYSAVFLIGLLGLGLYISDESESQQQVMFVTYFVLMIFVLMGGVFTPVESMPEWGQQINRLNPIYYMIKVMRMVVLKGATFIDILPQFLSTLAISSLLLTLAVVRYKKRA